MRVRAINCLKSSELPLVKESFFGGDLLTGLTRMLCQVDVELITASPAANGFFNAKGMSGFIPNAYSLLEQHTWQRLNRAWERDKGSSASHALLEYDRPGWQFHCKGIWWASTLILT